MRRREFLGIAGATAAIWPVVASAQQTKVRRVGVLISSPENDAQVQRQLSALRKSLSDLGWIEGRDLVLDTRFPEDEPGRMQAFAHELVALKPDVLVASGPTPVLALRQVSRTIPIVFTQVNDPVGAGLVDSLAQPGRTLTGFSPGEFSLGGKLVELLKEIAPRTEFVGALLDPALTDQAGMWQTMQDAASTARVRLKQLNSANAASMEQAIAEFASASGDALVVLANRITNTNRRRIIAAAAIHNLPAVYSYGYFVSDGGLASYGADVTDLYARAGVYVDKLLRGVSAADLPIQQPTKYVLVINLKTAKALGLTIPQALLATADEVIE
jgi:putative tryptophan/tyrosine transport system substrate-binding protein